MTRKKKGKKNRPCGHCLASYKAEYVYCTTCGRPINRNDHEDIKQIVAEAALAEARGEDTSLNKPPAEEASEVLSMTDTTDKKTEATEPSAADTAAAEMRAADTPATAPVVPTDDSVLGPPEADLHSVHEAEPTVLVDAQALEPASEPIIELTNRKNGTAAETAADGQPAETTTSDTPARPAPFLTDEECEAIRQAVNEAVNEAEPDNAPAGDSTAGTDDQFDGAITQEIKDNDLAAAGLKSSRSKKGLFGLLAVVVIGLLLAGVMLYVFGPLKQLSDTTESIRARAAAQTAGRHKTLTPRPLQPLVAPAPTAQPAPATAPTVTLDVSDCRGDKVTVVDNRVILKGCVRALPATY